MCSIQANVSKHCTNCIDWPDGHYLMAALLPDGFVSLGILSKFQLFCYYCAFTGCEMLRLSSYRSVSLSGRSMSHYFNMKIHCLETLMNRFVSIKSFKFAFETKQVALLSHVVLARSLRCSNFIYEMLSFALNLSGIMQPFDTQ